MLFTFERNKQIRHRFYGLLKKPVFKRIILRRKCREFQMQQLVH